MWTKINLPAIPNLVLFAKNQKTVHSSEIDIRLLLKAIKDYPSSKIIVDYGCGNGHLGTILAKMFSKSMTLLLADNAESAGIARLNVESNKLQNAKVILGEISDITYTPDIVIIRVTGYEGKKRLEYRIRQTLNALTEKGQLILICHKKKGAPSLLKMTADIFSSAEIVSKSGGYWIIRSQKAPHFSLDKISSHSGKVIHYQLKGRNYKFETEPGLFSKDHVDEATHLLLENLDAKDAKQILDLGTGYGVIGIVLADQYPEAQVLMVDVDLQPVNVANRNIKLNRVNRNTQVILCENLQEISSKKFDLVVSNFPLHIPYKKKVNLFNECKEMLNPGGRFYVTVVRIAQYDLRPLMKNIFDNVTTVIESGKEGQGSRVSYSVKTA